MEGSVKSGQYEMRHPASATRPFHWLASGYMSCIGKSASRMRSLKSYPLGSTKRSSISAWSSAFKGAWRTPQDPRADQIAEETSQMPWPVPSVSRSARLVPRATPIGSTGMATPDTRGKVRGETGGALRPDPIPASLSPVTFPPGRERLLASPESHWIAACCHDDRDRGSSHAWRLQRRVLPPVADHMHP